MKNRFWIMASLMFAALNSFAQDEFYVPVSDDLEIAVNQFPAEGKYLMLWLAPEYGFRAGHQSLAQMLPEHGIEVWQSDIVESLFLPPGSNSLKQLDGRYIADVIEYAHKTTGKKIIVAGDSYAAISALTAAHQWQRRQLNTPYLIGAILFSPYTFAYIPSLGLAPEYVPIVSSSNIPIMIYQAKNSGTFGEFQMLVEKLSQHGSPVYTRLIPNVMSLFYEHEPTTEMKKAAEPLPHNIKQIVAVLEQHEVPDKPVPLIKSTMSKSGIDIYLKAFKGESSPTEIRLKDINGNDYYKSNFKGQVTVVNFWATWCPPCIEEIPSLNRLKKKMRDQSFELISINYAEDKKTISEFMKEVKVEFPVLLDSTGDYSRKWNVISYPSTFIIDKEGKIKYGVNAAIEWDSPELIHELESLL